MEEKRAALGIMPMGDSITTGDGSTDDGGYRAPLFRRIVVAGGAATFVGGSPFPSGPSSVGGVPFPRAHEGYPGIMVEGMLVLAAGTVAHYAPDVVLLMIGANDDERPPEVFGASFGRLVDAIVDVRLDDGSRPRLVVSTITPTRDDARNRRVDAFNAAIREQVDRCAVRGGRISLVDANAAFRANGAYRTAYLADIVHPNDAGYEILAETWYAGLTASS